MNTYIKEDIIPKYYNKDLWYNWLNERILIYNLIYNRFKIGCDGNEINFSGQKN